MAEKSFRPYLTHADECHRGSAKEESRWRRILEYFSSATQIGMTATPKETKYISNLSYFGEPIYMYLELHKVSGSNKNSINLMKRVAQ